MKDNFGRFWQGNGNLFNHAEIRKDSDYFGDSFLCCFLDIFIF